MRLLTCIGRCGNDVSDRHKTVCDTCWPALPTHLQKQVLRKKRLTPQQRIELDIDLEHALKGRAITRRRR